MDDSVRDLLRAAGQDPEKMNPAEVKFVYSFIENWKNGNQDLPPPMPRTPPPTSKPSLPVPPAYNTRIVPPASDVRHNRPLPQVC